METGAINTLMTKGEWEIDNQLDQPALVSNETYVISAYNYGADSCQAEEEEAEANIHAVALAVKNTFGKGINPDSVYSMYSLLNELEEYFKKEQPHGEWHTKIHDVLNETEFRLALPPTELYTCIWGEWEGGQSYYEFDVRAENGLFFSTDSGYDEGDIMAIAALKDGEYWQHPAGNHIIIKGNVLGHILDIDNEPFSVENFIRENQECLTDDLLPVLVLPINGTITVGGGAVAETTITRIE